MALALDLGNLVVHLTAKTQNFEARMKNAINSAERDFSKVKRIGADITKYIVAPLSIVGGFSVKAFANFDSAMTKSLAIMGNVTPQMRRQMEDVAKTISSRGVKSATELAQSYFYLASAGLDVQQSIGALPVVEKFATAGMFDMSLATDLLTDAQSALGLTVKDSATNMRNMTHVSDVLVKANVLANASVQQFSTALTSKAGTAMKSYNIDLEEGVAILAAYADQGIKAEFAGSMFDRMLRLTIKSINDNQQAWDKWGITTKDTQGNLAPLADILEQITNRTKDMGAIQKAAALEMLGFEARSQQAILPLLGLSDNIRTYEERLRSAGGVTKEIADKQLKSFSSEMKNLWNNIVIAGIEIGESLTPQISFLADKIKKSMGSFQMFGASVKATASLVWQTWEWASNKSALAWETFKISINNTFAGIKIIVFKAAKYISDIFWSTIKDITFAFTTTIRQAANSLESLMIISKKTRQEMIKSAFEMDQKILKSSNDSVEFYANLITENTENIKSNWEDYYKKVGDLDALYTEQTKARIKERNQAWAEGYERQRTSAINHTNVFEEINEKIKGFLNIRTQAVREQTEEEIKIEQQKKQALITATNSWIGVATQVAELGGKKMFKVYKTFAMAEAASAAYLAFNKTLAIGGAFSAQLAFSYLALGLLNVRRIAMMKPGGGIGGVGGGGGGTISSFGATTTAGQPAAEEFERREEKPANQITVIVENVHGTADAAFADIMADAIKDRIKDGRDYGVTVSAS